MPIVFGFDDQTQATSIVYRVLPRAGINDVFGARPDVMRLNVRDEVTRVSPTKCQCSQVVL